MIGFLASATDGGRGTGAFGCGNSTVVAAFFFVSCVLGENVETLCLNFGSVQKWGTGPTNEGILRFFGIRALANSFRKSSDDPDGTIVESVGVAAADASGSFGDFLSAKLASENCSSVYPLSPETASEAASESDEDMDVSLLVLKGICDAPVGGKLPIRGSGAGFGSARFTYWCSSSCCWFLS